MMDLAPVDLLIDDVLQTWGNAQGVGDTLVDVPVIETDADLDRFLLERFGVFLPNVVVCSHKGHTTPWQAFHDAYFARGEVAVWKASRGLGGKTFLLGLLALTEALTLRADVNVLGGSGEQSARVLESFARFWNHPAAPRRALESDPAAAKQRLVWGNVVRALKASQTSVRGPHPQRLRCDEVDEMDFGILKSALGQPMSKGQVLSQIVLSSTHQYPDGTMTTVLNLAAEKGWRVYEWCLEETREPHGWLTEVEIWRKRAQMTHLDWVTEVELQEPNPEDLAILRDAVNAMFDPALAFEDEPDPAAVYAHGADWAKKSAHLTAIATLRKWPVPDPLTLAAFHTTHREAWPVMVGYLEDRQRKFGGTVVHDATGIGDVIGDYLSIVAEGFIMVGRARADMFTEFIAAVERGDMRIPDNERTRKLKRVLQLCTRQMLFGDEHPPDEVVALALAYRAALLSAPPVATMREPAGQDHLTNLGQRQRPTSGIFGPRRGLGDLGRR